MIDATVVRAHPCATGYEKGQHGREVLGHRKGGFASKIHAVVDPLGQATRFTLTTGQRHDITQASHLLEGFEKVNSRMKCNAFGANLALKNKGRCYEKIHTFEL